MAGGQKEYKRYVFAVSDATGRTCETVVLAALSQFKTTQIVLETLSNVRTPQQVHEVFTRAAAWAGGRCRGRVEPRPRAGSGLAGRGGSVGDGKVPAAIRSPTARQ